MGVNHPAKKTLASWAQRDETYIAVKSDIHRQKENGLELFRSRRHFEEIKQAKITLLKSATK